MISLSAITFLLMTDGTDLQTACLSAWRTVRVDLRNRCRRAVRVKLPLCHLAISSLVVLLPPSNIITSSIARRWEMVVLPCWIVSWRSLASGWRPSARRWWGEGGTPPATTDLIQYPVLCVYLTIHLLERDVHVPFWVGLCVCVIRNRVEWESRWTGLQKSAADDLVGAHLPTCPPYCPPPLTHPPLLAWIGEPENGI